MSNQQNQLNDGGSISACASCSSLCGYGCCHQALLHEEDFGPENSLLLFPGEFEAASEEMRRHILVTVDNFHEGKLGYCDRDHFDQSECDANQNLKPLDCQSYPFFPAIVNGELTLKIDKKRCPLPISVLAEHYESVLRKWRVAVEKNPAIKEWIGSFGLNGYLDFNQTPDE